jgi:hypothetical protein
MYSRGIFYARTSFVELSALIIHTMCNLTFSRLVMPTFSPFAGLHHHASERSFWRSPRGLTQVKFPLLTVAIWLLPKYAPSYERDCHSGSSRWLEDFVRGDLFSPFHPWGTAHQRDADKPRTHPCSIPAKTKTPCQEFDFAFASKDTQTTSCLDE